MTKQNMNPIKRSNIARVVRNILDSQLENKVIIVSITAAATPLAGTVINLSNDVIQGDNFNQRSGDIIAPVSHTIKTATEAITNNQITRFILFSDRMNQGTTPTVLEILNTADTLSPYNSLTVYQQKRFNILYDKTFTVNVNGEAIKMETRKLRTPGKVYYNGSTGVAASNGRNSMFILVIGSETSGEYDFSWECNYHDA